MLLKYTFRLLTTVYSSGIAETVGGLFLWHPKSVVCMIECLAQIRGVVNENFVLRYLFSMRNRIYPGNRKTVTAPTPKLRLLLAKT